jgi:small subunit ribosomal protein S16
MSAAIRLMRFGKRGFPSYRIVVLDKRKKRDGGYIEQIGSYNPLTKPAAFKIDKERLEVWIKNGAQLSEAMTKLLKNRK